MLHEKPSDYPHLHPIPPELGSLMTASVESPAGTGQQNTPEITLGAEQPDRKSDWNVEMTPEIAEAVDTYLSHESSKMTEAEVEVDLLSWAENFRSSGAEVPPESLEADKQHEREAIENKLEILGCKSEVNLVDELPYIIDRRLGLLHTNISKIYADAVLPITFITDAERDFASRLNQRANMLLQSVKAAHINSGRPLTYQVAELSDVNIPGSVEQAQADLKELLDSDMTMYAHTTNFLDKVIQDGYLSPRTEDRVATTGNHSTGVHFSRDTYDVPRFGFDGPGLGDYLRKNDLRREDLLRGDIIFPLGALIKAAPIRTENSTPKYEYENIWGDKRTGPLNLSDPQSVEFVKPESVQKMVDESTGTTRKQAGDTLFYAAEDSEQAYEYTFPIGEAYLIVENEADGARARAQLSEAGYSSDWIASHLVVNVRNNGVREVRSRLSAKSARMVAPLLPRKSPYEYRDYTNNQQFSTQTELVILAAPAAG